MSPQRILVTNDDGIGTRGLETLVAAAADGHRDVVVAAPERDVSAMGTALGLTAEMPVQARVHRSADSSAGVAARFEVAAYPAGIVTLAMMGAFGPPPDLVLVGVNHGSNVGPGLVHSSTVGAALTAAVYGARAVAFSVPAGNVDWPAVRSTVTRLVNALPETWPANGALSVNLPCCPDPQLSEAVWCEVSGPTAVGELVRTGSTVDGLTLRVSYRPMTDALPNSTDAGALAQGKVAIAWLRLPYGAVAGSGRQADLLGKFI